MRSIRKFLESRTALSSLPLSHTNSQFAHALFLHTTTIDTPLSHNTQSSSSYTKSNSPSNLWVKIPKKIKFAKDKRKLLENSSGRSRIHWPFEPIEDFQNPNSLAYSLSLPSPLAPLGPRNCPLCWSILIHASRLQFLSYTTAIRRRNDFGESKSL